MIIRNNWTREELIVAFNLYCKIPFTKINDQYKPVIELAHIIGRTPGAVSFKLANYARLDPSLQKRNVSGLKNGSKGEVEIWKEFHGNWEALAYESEKLLAQFKNESIEVIYQIEISNLPVEGKEREALVKLRVNQQFFRSTVLVSYQNSCCITGLQVPELLVASHIIPWSKGKEYRVNPENGLCLNALHDKAFDRGLLTITDNFKVQLSEKLLSQVKDEIISQYFLPFHQKGIIRPVRFSPRQEFLQFHRENIFIR